MKAAAAVLAGSLLFFLGVVTGVGRRESVPPPGPIPLGAVANPAPPSDPLPPGTGAPGDATGAPVTTGPAAPTPPASTSPTSPTRPPGSPNSPGPVSETPVSPPTSATTVTTGSSITTRPVEQVGNQVDCTKRGRGKREPCPSTTTATGDERGGGGQP